MAFLGPSGSPTTPLADSLKPPECDWPPPPPPPPPLDHYSELDVRIAHVEYRLAMVGGTAEGVFNASLQPDTVEHLTSSDWRYVLTRSPSLFAHVALLATSLEPLLDVFVRFPKALDRLHELEASDTALLAVPDINATGIYRAVRRCGNVAGWCRLMQWPGHVKANLAHYWAMHVAGRLSRSRLLDACNSATGQAAVGTVLFWTDALVLARQAEPETWAERVGRMLSFWARQRRLSASTVAAATEALVLAVLASDTPVTPASGTLLLSHAHLVRSMSAGHLTRLLCDAVAHPNRNARAAVLPMLSWGAVVNRKIKAVEQAVRLCQKRKQHAHATVLQDWLEAGLKTLALALAQL